MKHFICRGCGNLVATVNYTGKKISCCEENMQELTPNVSEASAKKHTPRIEIDGKKVTVFVGEGENAHPMLDEHSVLWVSLVTTEGNQRKVLKPSLEPKAVFYIGENEKVINAFAFCNLHGLWVSKSE